MLAQTNVFILQCMNNNNNNNNKRSPTNCERYFNQSKDQTTVCSNNIEWKPTKSLIGTSIAYKRPLHVQYKFLDRYWKIGLKKFSGMTSKREERKKEEKTRTPFKLQKIRHREKEIEKFAVCAQCISEICNFFYSLHFPHFRIFPMISASLPLKHLHHLSHSFRL